MKIDRTHSHGHVGKPNVGGPSREQLTNAMLATKATSSLFIDTIPNNSQAARQMRDMGRKVTKTPHNKSAGKTVMAALKFQNNRHIQTQATRWGA
jgi:hypothetical protein